MKGSGWNEEEVLRETMGKEPKRSPLKTVMVYCMDSKNMRKEPIGILMERRKTDRENNAIGMLRLARKEFAKTEEESRKILIGDTFDIDGWVRSDTMNSAIAPGSFKARTGTSRSSGLVAGPRGGEPVTVLSRVVDVEPVRVVLDRPDPQSFSLQRGDQPLQQGRFPRPGIPYDGDRERFHEGGFPC